MAAATLAGSRERGRGHAHDDGRVAIEDDGG
jgi:hypothetical protein